MTPNSNDDGQKRCKCKKTMCLKLYCDCFAHGLYCDVSCSCQECFNSPDYEDTVDETRKQIELRNPHAFSSKIRAHTQSPTSYNEDGDQQKLIIGKHRKGCNCRKSMCMKKYCECYQANLGCGAECRCDGCENVFGKRGVYNKAIDETALKELKPVGLGFSSHEFHNPQNLSPTTPLQHLGRENNALPTGRYISSQGSAMMFGASIGNYGMATLDEQLYRNNDEFMNQFAPPNDSKFYAKHLESGMNLPPMMDYPHSSTASENYSSVISSPKVYGNNENADIGDQSDFN